jgi:hypothetical protein
MAAHDMILTFAPGPGQEAVQQEIADCDDTGGNYATFKNFGDDTHMILRQNAYLTDALVTATGGTVTRYTIEVNGVDIGRDLLNAGLGAGVNNRLPNPIGPFRKGAEIRILQSA